MSQVSPELQAIADGAFRALNAGDRERFVALTTEDVEFTSLVAEVEGTTFRGHDGVRAWWETVRGAFDEVGWQVLDLRGTDDRGVAQLRMSGVVRGVPVQQAMWQAFRLRDGKASWWAFFRDEREAVEAAGLSSQGRQLG